MSALPPEVDATRWYAERVARHGFDYRGLGFRTRSSQEKRFEALLARRQLERLDGLDPEWFDDGAKRLHTDLHRRT